MQKTGDKKSQIWTEYMEDYRSNDDEPLMYSQFCYHIQQDKQKRYATMHINRKPGEHLTCHSATVIYKTRVRSLIFRLTTLTYHRRILFTDFFSQSLIGSDITTNYAIQRRSLDYI